MLLDPRHHATETNSKADRTPRSPMVSPNTARNSTQAEDALRVWGVGTPRTLRVHWMLAELELSYETREILPRTAGMQDPDFQTIAPRGKVPILEDGELVVGESGAILFHLATRDGVERQLAPSPGSAERARFDDLCFFTLTELDAPLYVIRRHAGLPEVYGESPVAVHAARDYFLRQVAEMQRQLCDGRPHLMGEAFTLADILLMSCLGWAQHIEIELPQTLDAYGRRLARRPAYQRGWSANFPPTARAAVAGRRPQGS